MGKTYTVYGTADYFAPETLRQSGYNRAVDWWACGVLLFMISSGTSPFDAPDVIAFTNASIIQNIRNIQIIQNIINIYKLTKYLWGCKIQNVSK